MKILMVNKFLHPNGGSETYVFKLGDYLANHGHQVQYFGMDHEKRIVGNDVNAYTANQDFHSTGLKRFLYPVKVIYSVEARRKIRLVLDNFSPDVVHLNNFNFQLTPSIIYEIRKYQRQTKKKVKIVFTAHDYQLVCPNHLMYNQLSKSTCDKCVGGKFINCTKDKCIHGSLPKSLIGSVEGYLYNTLKTYTEIDAIICPSKFMEGKMKGNSILGKKTRVLHNFVDFNNSSIFQKEDYILYFGRFSHEKGIDVLLEVFRALPHINFVVAGTGDLGVEFSNLSNVKNVGFKSGKELVELIQKARISLHPSVCFENCPFSVMESQIYGTPVLGSNIGGIPELVKIGETGELFKSGDALELREKILNLWNNKVIIERYSRNCEAINFDTIESYANKIITIYQQELEEIR